MICTLILIGKVAFDPCIVTTLSDAPAQVVGCTITFNQKVLGKYWMFVPESCEKTLERVNEGRK